MNLKQLQQLVTQGESDRLEFKRSTGELREGMETLCGFLNEQGGITIDDLKREHTSQPRNPTLASVFYLRGLIERWGRGTQKIVELCRAAGHPEPEFEERAGEVVVRFLPSEYIPPHRVSHDLTDRQREILQVLGNGERYSFRDVYELLTDPPSDRWVREDMTMLRKLGLIDSSGRGPHARWWLVPAE